ncbi:hypothetical protein C483_12313 [Natrialba hulunbeirensis JCM 10989]|uniref:Uncharacterized protein n=2 Tax=Natrialba hulunbeirensis TaxID=123783 RepID=L9ZYS5_9EURY|nr:hypothetical protein C483_12313 [Natrialba hulunbeirensis JCM 10989]
MSSAARERLGDADIASPVEYKPSSETSGRTYPKPTIEYAKTKWDNVGDEFAVRLSKGFFEHSEYQIDQLKSREDNIWIERSDTKQANCFGYWAQHDQDGFWPSIRMGSNARERLGHVDTGTQCEVKKFTGIWPRMGVALSDWGEEVGNALLCGINEKTAAKLGVEKGDMVTVRSRAFNQKRVFQVHRVYSDHETDRMRAVMRTARWGRHRFTNADGASVKNDSPRFTSPSEPDEVDKLTEDDVIGLDVEIEPFEPEEGQKYVGVSQARSEWDFSMTNERVFFHEELVDEFNILTKFDGEPIDRSFEPEEANVTEGWDNLRLHHADYPDDRYQAYTAYGTYSDDREVPRIRMTWFARRHLNNPEYDDEVFDKGQWDQDRHGVPRSFVVQLDTDTEYQVPNPDLRKPDIDEPALRNSTGTVEQEVQAIAEQGLPHANVYHPTVYEEEESAEWYKDSPDKRFLPFAPHGGDTEWRTSRICYYIAQELDTPYWIHEGYRETIGSSFDRWHTTSSDMRNGYPAIEALGFDWDYSLSIHGFTADGILVGGLLDQELRETYGGYLVEALPDEDVHVYGDDHPSWAESFAGTNPRNITNEFTNGGERNGRGGIQLELPSSVRTEQCKWVDVAEATIAFYRQEMNIE